MSDMHPSRRHELEAGRSRLYPALVTLGLLATVVMLFALVGTDWWEPDAPLDTFRPEGPAAQIIQDLVNPVFIAAGVVFLAVEGAVVYIIARFRVKPDEEEGYLDEDLPKQVHGDIRFEIGWTLLPAVILAAIAVGTIVTIFELNSVEEDALPVKVVGQQWWWAYEYDLDDDGFAFPQNWSGDEADDADPEVVTANELVIPAGRQVELTITSTDVIHSFWIPSLNGKKDAVPGREHTWTIEADEPGRYRGQCTEFCGLSHARMQMYVIALPEDQWEEWLDVQQRPAVEYTEDDVENGDITQAEFDRWTEGQAAFVSACATCHLVDGVNTEEFIAQGGAAQVSGTAPPLTHLMSRESFAGSTLYLYLGLDSDSPIDNYLTKDGLEVNEIDLEAWLRNPSAIKPMAPDPTHGNEFGRGMPDLGLTEEQIDNLTVYLTSLE